MHYYVKELIFQKLASRCTPELSEEKKNEARSRRSNGSGG